MEKRILIIGGYGNFGSFITHMLAREPDIQLMIGGRNTSKAEAFIQSIDTQNKPITVTLDINRNLSQVLKELRPYITIHTSGPYQGQGYHVAQACIEYGSHYIDLADARDFVKNIYSLDKAAKDQRVLICSGASSVPTLTSAIIDKYLDQFHRLEKIEYAISTAQKTGRGLATTSAVLSYAGKPFKTLINGEMKNVYGWLNLRFKKFWQLGQRPLGNCDIPDLALFPQRYPSLKTIRFQAGLELKSLHLPLCLFSWMVRLHLLPSLQRFAPTLLRISHLFDSMGKDDSGFYMRMTGIDKALNAKRIQFDLVARNGDGLYIPSMPAILMAKKLLRGEIVETGAYPCMGFITLDEYLRALGDFSMFWKVS